MINSTFRNAISELSIPEWTAFIITQSEFQENPFFVEQIMSVISRQFGNLNNAARQEIIKILVSQKCIVTKQGLKFPSESYFKSVTLFTDLPIVMFENNKSVSDSFLKALGVRDYVDLQLVFSRLQDLKWDSDHVQLVCNFFGIP